MPCNVRAAQQFMQKNMLTAKCDLYALISSTASRWLFQGVQDIIKDLQEVYKDGHEEDHAGKE